MCGILEAGGLLTPGSLGTNMREAGGVKTPETEGGGCWAPGFLGPG